MLKSYVNRHLLKSVLFYRVSQNPISLFIFFTGKVLWIALGQCSKQASAETSAQTSAHWFTSGIIPALHIWVALSPGKEMQESQDAGWLLGHLYACHNPEEEKHLCSGLKWSSEQLSKLMCSHSWLKTMQAWLWQTLESLPVLCTSLCGNTWSVSYCWSWWSDAHSTLPSWDEATGTGYRTTERIDYFLPKCSKQNLWEHAKEHV